MPPPTTSPNRSSVGALIVIVLLVFTGLVLVAIFARPESAKSVQPKVNAFQDNFSTQSVLQEAGKITSSQSPNWWLSSGGLFYTRGGYAQTATGDQPAGSKWQAAYAASSPADTDGGLHPQNLFRLVMRHKFRDFTQQVAFRMDQYHLSASPNRDASNGMLLFNRYKDADNLYYTGLRVDGRLVIKKKQAGTYYTMAEKSVLPGTYNHDNSPNLIPVGQWINLRSVVTTAKSGAVTIEIWSDMAQPGKWEKLLVATDDGHKYGGAPITAAGYGGMRTDFMDASFKNYSIREQP